MKGENEKLIEETCITVLKTLAEKEGISAHEICLRSDLKDEQSELILSIFKGKDFIRKVALKEVVKASGFGGIFTKIIKKHISTLLKQVLLYTKEQNSLTDIRFACSILRLKENEQKMKGEMALYTGGIYRESLMLSDIISGTYINSSKNDNE